MRKAPHSASGMTLLAVTRDDSHNLQDFLAGRLGLSRRAAKAVIDGRSVWVNRACVWMARFALKAGDSVELPTMVVKAAQSQAQGQVSSRRKDQASRPVAQRHVRVLWQDEAYLMVDKPAGLLSCDDLRSVESLLREQEQIPTLEAVHRLDRDTSGCLLFAKNHAAKEAAIALFRTHRVTKIYHAISVGRFAYAHQIVENPLDGQPALSWVTREAVGLDASFLRIRIETGRTNQIRRHLAAIRAPIVGDRVYGLKSARDARLMQVPRQMLHASTLSLPHPLCPKEELRIHSPLPADFRAALRLFGMGK